MAGPALAPILPVMGYAVLSGMIATWIAMSELLQTLQDDYDKPLFITSVVHGGYAWFLIPWYAIRSWAAYQGEDMRISARYRLTLPKLAGVALLSATLSYVCAYTWYLSLTRTTVAANNSIYQSCAAFVYVFSVFWLHEKVTLLKTLAVIISICGVVMVSTAPTTTTETKNRTTAVGYMWLLVSVLAYGMYEVFQKKYLEQELVQHVPLVDADSLEPSIESATLMSSNRADEDASEAAQTTDHAAPDLTSLRLRVELSVLMLGCYGVMTILLSIPSLLIWNAAGLEVFEHPPSHKVGMLALNTGLDSIYNVLLLFGILVTTPLFMSVGVMLVMPFSIVVDRILHGTELGPSGVLGAIVIVIGFALLNVPPEASERCSLAMRRWLCSRKADTLYE